jgi:Protein of unknown function (DUF1345)
VVYKPVRKEPSGQPKAHVPSWKVPTEPEPRWAAFAATAIIIAGQTWVADSLAFRPIWLFPALSAGLLIASLAVYLPTRTEPSRPLRMLALGLLGLLGLADVVSLALLVRGVFLGSHLDALGLLLAGAVLWLVNVCVFALGYWELDGGGPEARSDGYNNYPDLVFPQQQQDQQGLTPADWKPTFADFLYTSLTAATAFSPTDAMPYSRRVKLVMGLESTISFVIIAMLVARAVNIAHG